MKTVLGLELGLTPQKIDFLNDLQFILFYEWMN